MFSYLIEILCFFIRQHYHRSKSFVLQKNISDRIAQRLQSEEKYLALLKKIALEWSSLKRDDNLVHALKQSSCLGAYKEIVGVDSGSKDEDNVKEFLLAKAQDIYIQDDITAYRVFKGQIAVAPEDEALEALYKVCFLLARFCSLC